MLVFFLPAQAGDTSQLNITSQQDQQKKCAQQLAKRCTDKCQKGREVADCALLCQENAKNECKYAGE